MTRHAPLAIVLVAVIGGMTGLSFAAVPLYRLFCEVTGYGGTPQTGPATSPGVIDRKITVRFDANTSPALPWRFRPEQPQITLRLGEESLAFYEATNTARGDVTGMATYNVTPDKAARYFHKTACFCFDEQTLAAGQAMQFPLTFFVDPAIATDPETRDITTITLSYTFFPRMTDAQRAAAQASAGPHVGKLLR